MNVENRGMTLRSNPYTWVNNSNLEIDRSFLKQAIGKMRAPVIRELIFHARLQVTGVTATLLAKDAHKVFQRITVGDRGGLLFDCSGAVARLIEQMEIGAGYQEPNNGTALASAATTDVYDVFSRVIFDVEKAHRGADTALPLNHLFDGGKLTVRCGTPPGCTMTGATIRVYAEVHEEREPEAKTRMSWRERAISKAEDDYSIGGSLRAAFITSVLDTTGHTALDTETATITSKTLEMFDLDQAILQQIYKRLVGHNQARIIAGDSVDGFLNSLTAPDAIALRVPSKGQHIGKMEDLQTLHLKLVSAPTGGVLVTCQLEDRNVDLARETMGFETMEDYASAVAEMGAVAAKGKSNKAAGLWPAKLARRMPLVLNGEG